MKLNRSWPQNSTRYINVPIWNNLSKNIFKKLKIIIKQYIMSIKYIKCGKIPKFVNFIIYELANCIL